jgi:hypothetical protein
VIHFLTVFKNKKLTLASPGGILEKSGLDCKGGLWYICGQMKETLRVVDIVDVADCPARMRV